MKTYQERIELAKKMLREEKSFREIMKKHILDRTKLASLRKRYLGRMSIPNTLRHTDCFVMGIKAYLM
jgi:hypothetical protein